jgi:hypothetical protein
MNTKTTLNLLLNGGGGIRTHEGLATPTVFETGRLPMAL